jgi:hypothetical protein
MNLVKMRLRYSKLRQGFVLIFLIRQLRVPLRYILWNLLLLALLVLIRLRWRAVPCPLFLHEDFSLELSWYGSWCDREGFTIPGQDSAT